MRMHAVCNVLGLVDAQGICGCIMAELLELLKFLLHPILSVTSFQSNTDQCQGELCSCWHSSTEIAMCIWCRWHFGNSNASCSHLYRTRRKTCSLEAILYVSVFHTFDEMAFRIKDSKILHIQTIKECFGTGSERWKAMNNYHTNSAKCIYSIL